MLKAFLSDILHMRLVVLVTVCWSSSNDHESHSAAPELGHLQFRQMDGAPGTRCAGAEITRARDAVKHDAPCIGSRRACLGGASCVARVHQSKCDA